MKQERACINCHHFSKVGSISEVPSLCWSCVGQHGRGDVHLPYWEPINQEQSVSDGQTEAKREGVSTIACATPKEDPLKVQVGGAHYKTFKIQPIEFIAANNLDYFQGNIVKYVCRKKDNRIQDLNKIKHYVDLYILAIQRGDIV